MADYIFLKKNGKGADIKVSRQDFAKNPNAYRDYTVRMVDKDGSNWDVPFNHINDAVKDGAHVFNMRENTPQQKTTTPAPQPKSAVVQQAVNFTQKPAQPYQPTWQEQAGMSMAVDQAANMGGSDVQPMVKPGLDTNMLNQNNALANRAMATNLESNQDNLYLDELEKQANELAKQGMAEVNAKESEKPFSQRVFENMNSTTKAGYTSTPYTREVENNEKIRQANLIQTNVRDARKAIKDAEISQDGSWYQKLGRGLANGVDVRNFDFGITKLRNALTLRSAVNNRNDVNNAILDSEALKNKIIKENEDQISDWIKAGETTTIMVPFMLQILSSPFKGLGTAASKWVMSKVGQEIAGSLGKRAALLALKGTTRFLGDAVEGAGTAAFFNAAGITADAMRRQRGNAVGQYGSDGYFHYNEMKDGEDSYAKAFAKAFGASAIEYQSELVGYYFSPLLKGIGKVAGKGLQKAGVLGIKEGFDTTGKKFTNIMLNFGGKNVSLDKTIGMITALSNKQYLKAFNDFTKATRWNGVIGEYAEEVVGNIENAALIGDMNWGTGKNGVFNPEQNWETFLSVAVGGGFLGALGGVSYMGSRLAVNRGLKKSDEMGMELFGADAWRSIKDGFETADNPARFLAAISQNLDEPSKRAIQNYAAYSMAKKGELVADMKQRMEEPQPTNVRITPYKGRFVVQSVDPNGNIIESKDYDSEEDANIYKERVATYIDNARKVQAYNDFILRGDTEKFFGQLGFDFDYDTYSLLKKIAYKDPLKRTDAEQEYFDNFINSTENITYPTNEVHEEHDAQKGADLAEETSENIVEGAKPVNDREAAAKTRWNAVIQSQPDIDSLVGSLVNQGMTSNEIAQRLVDDYGGESEVVEAFCELCNAKANKDGYINRIGQLIQSKVENDIDEAAFAGTVNGNEDKSNIYLLTNGTNSFALIGGEITVDSNNNISSNGIAIMLDGQGNRITRPDLTGFSLKGIVDKNQYERSSLLELQQEATAAIQATEIPIQLFNNSDIDTLSPEMPNNNGLTAPEVPQQEQPQEQPQAQAEEQPQEQPATPENTSLIPLDEKGKRLYHKAPIEATINDLYDGALEDEEIRSFVQNNINKSAKDYDKAIKKKPDTGTDKDAYLQAKQAWQQQVDEAKQKLDYWNSVNDYIQQQTHTTPEEIQKAQDELSGKTAQQEYANSKPDMSVTPVQFAGEFIRESKIQTQSFYNETGFGDAERKKFPKMIANDGKTIDSLAEELVSADDTYHNGSLYHGDTTEAKNAILEALQTASKKSELGKNTSDDFKEYERQREEAREAFYEENFNMSYSDYLAFEEQQMPNIWRRMSNFVAEEYDRIVNESYELRDEQNNVEQINNENNGNNTEGNQQLAGGSEVLPTEGSNQQGGTSTSTNPAAETTNGSEGGNQNEEVPGGTQGTIGLPVALSYLLEGGRGSILSTVYFLHGVAAAFPKCSAAIENLIQKYRDEISDKPSEFAASNHKIIDEIRSEVYNSYGDNGIDILNTLFSQPTGFYPKESKDVARKIEELQEDTQGVGRNNEPQKKNSVSDNTTDTDETVNNGKLNDTATQQNTVSDNKDTTKSPNLQENQQKTDKKVEELQEEESQLLTEADIDADEIADEYSKELAKDFLRGENTGTIAELFYREIAGRAQKKGEKKEEKKPSETKPSNTPPTGQAESNKPKSEPKEKKPKTETPKTSEQKTSLQQALDEFKDVMRQFRDAGRMDASVSLVGLNSRQIEMLGKVFRATAKLGYEIIKKGATSFENWLETMKAQVADIIKVNSNWNDQDITDLLTEAWNNKYPVDGVYKPLSQWAAEEALAAEQKQEDDQPAETPEAPAAEQTKVAERKFVDNVATTLTSAMETGEKPYASIVALRKAAREAGMEVGENGETDIKIQELVEDALVRVAKNIMTTAHIAQVANKANNKFAKEIFEKIKLLYNLQPTISMRSSNRIALQQYSTPLPMAFVADMFATGAKAPLFFNVFEPTAGNGMLVFAIPSSQVHVNEIDENRLDNLRGQEFRQVTTQDATQPFAGDRKYNAIITNPPFGSTEAKDYDGYSISGLAPQIALNALDKMKDNGKAVIIIGGKQEFAPNGAIKNDKPFLAYLYNHYNVKGVIDMDGSLYAKQGTTFPTRMILIDGRRTEEERAKSDVYPPTIKNWINPVADFDRLYDTVNELLNSKEKTNGTEIVRTEEQSATNIGNDTSRNTDVGGRKEQSTEGNQPIERVRGGLVSGNENVLVQPSGNDRNDGREQTGGKGVYQPSDRGNDGRMDGGKNGGGRTPNEHGTSGRGADTVGQERNAADGRQRSLDSTVHINGSTTSGDGTILKDEKRSLESEKLPYRPHNGAFSLESVAPAAMVEAMDKTLKRIEEEYGNIDEFVTSELGYSSLDDMHKALAAEQVDSVAMAIYNMKKGEAIVIGDQTGVGKGRQMAALIRWARRQGKKPIFMTQKSNLFNDIYRDLKDIGSENLRPFIFNSDRDANIKEITEDKYGNEKEKVVYKYATEKELADAIKYGKIPDDYDFVLSTYSQISSGDDISREYEAQMSKQENGDNKKRSRTRKPKPGAKPRKPTKATLLRALAKDNYLMLDESHTAAGESNQGYYMQTLVRDSKAVTFASATYAKRPDTMPLYALRTAMSKANIGMRNLIAAIQKGGVTLQELMSRALSDSGQMVRRERDMAGVVTDWTTIDDPATVKKARENYDKTIKAFNAIIDFQKRYIGAYLDGQRETLAVRAGNAGFVKGTEDMGISNTPFANKTYNYTKQLMLALKADAIVDEVDKQIKAGRRPVIALDNTMGSMLTDIAIGEELEETTFAASLLKGLDSIMQYSQSNGMGENVKVRISPSELGEQGELAYYNLVSFIKESTKGVFISPLDEISNKLRAKGYKVGELTGREKVVVEENGKYYVAKKGKVSKQLLQSRFNSNKIDALIINKTGSTGISLHASKTFADQRQRVMILAQPLPDINDYMQMIGRIDRTGQVQRGYYINLGLPVPAEQRFLMMLSTKLKSLNANTTTSQDSKDNKVEAPDMLNKYGSIVIVEYFKDNPEIYNKMNDPLSIVKNGKSLSAYVPSFDDSDARKLTGYVALLSTEEQQAFYDDVVERYNALIKYLDDSGTNDLKITSLPLRAKTLAKAVSSEGKDPTGNNPFAQNAYVEKVEMDVLRKPMKADDIRKTINTLAEGKDPFVAVADIKNQWGDEYTAKREKENRRYEAELERNKAAVEKFAEKINANEKMPEKDKVKAINEKSTTLKNETERKHNENLTRLSNDYESLLRDFNRFSVGKTYIMPSDPNVLDFDYTSHAIFLGYKVKDKGITPSSSFAVFATLDGRRRVELKLSVRNALLNVEEITKQNYDAAQNVNLDNWDSNIPTTTRKEGYIMTGNILQAINDTQDDNGNFPGQLISYTDMEGNIRDGILMPDKWEPKMMTNAGSAISTALEQIKSGEIVISTNRDVEIHPSISRYGENMYYLRVPRSKKMGEKYYANSDLLKALGDKEFYEYSGTLQVSVDEDKLPDVLDVLSDMGVKVSSDIEGQLEEENATQQANTLAYNSSNNVNNPRIIPEDVDKDVSLQIESEFDSAIENLNLTEEEKDELENLIGEFSNLGTNDLEYTFYLNNSRLRIRDEKKNNLSDMLWRRGNSVSPSAANVGGNIRNEKSGAESPTTANGEYSAVVSRQSRETERGNTSRGNEVQGQYNGPRDIRNTGSDRLLLHEGRRIEEKVVSQTPRTRLSSHQRRLLAAQYAISRELVYRDIRLAAIKESLGLEAGKQTSLDDVAKIFEKYNKNKEVKALFDKILTINKRLGTSVEILESDENGNYGSAGTRRDVRYYLDGFTRTSSNQNVNIPLVIAHELLHQGTVGAINLVRKGKAEGVLTKEQIDAVNTIIDIYNKVKANPERLSESKRGLANPYEFAAQMVDPRQRRALSMSPLQRVIAAANELRAQGNPSLWQRIKNALKTLFGMSDLKKMDKAINTILDTFSETVHDISMNDVDQSGWGYFIGEQGASNMDKAEEATTRLDNLNVARYFENQGKDPKTIKWATGWERGADGKWRYEIPDITIKPDNKVDNKKANTRVIGRGFSQPIAKLSDIVESKELFDAYPQLKDIDITVTDYDGQTLASYNPIFKTITLPLLERVFENVYAPIKNWDEINEYIKNTQPFINSLTDEELDEAYEALGVFGPMADEELKNDKQWQKLKKESPKIAKFVEIKNSQPEKIGGEKIGIKVRDSQEARSWMSHEIQHAIQEIEGFASGGNLDSFEKDKEYSKLKEERLKIEQSKEYLDAKNEMDSTFDEMQKIRAMISEIKGKPGYSIFDENKEEKELEDKLEEAKEKYFKANDRLDKERKRIKALKEQIDKKIANYAYDYYTRVSGEVESRNVQSRINMTPEQRSHSLASETEDVGRQDQIFLNKYGDKMGMVSKDLFDKYPTWLSGQTTGTGQHTTQITSTVNTYKKIGEWMKSQGMKGASVLDASSGLGKGTEALRDMGFNVEDVEPYPSETRTKPTYLKYEDIKGKYDVVISNAVLNVIPDDWRADVLKNMADKVKPGGKMIINVRDAKEIEKQKQKIELDSPSEILVTDKAGNIRAYQKGFTQKELADWIQSELGEGWTIETAKPSNSGISGRAVVVTRNTETPLRYRKVSDSMQKPKTSEETKSRMRDAAASLAKSLNTPVKIVTSDEAPEEAKNAKGTYDTQTGEVVIVLDNNQSVLDIEKTVVHEIIGHHGLRGLLGSVRNYRQLMNVIYDSLPEEQKTEIKDKAMRNGYKFYEAMDEYFAEQAENMVWDSSSATMWDNIKHYITEAIRKLGFILRPNYRDIRYWLWLSKNNLQSDNPLSEIKRQAFLHKLSRLDAPKFDDNFYETENDSDIDYTEPETLFRNGKILDGTTRQIIEQRLKQKRNVLREGFIDFANGLRIMQEEMDKGIKGGIMDNQDAYHSLLASSSKVEEAQDVFKYTEIAKLQNILFDIYKFFDGKTIKEKYNNIINYIYKKHSLERNRVLFFRDWFRDNLKKKIEKLEDLPTEAYEIYEKKVIGIETDFEDGKIDKAQRDKALQDAVQESWLEYLENANNGFGKLHNILADKVDNKTITLADMYRQLDEYINQFTKYDPSKHDYSGLTAFAKMEGKEFDDAKFIEEVMAIEDSINRNDNKILGKFQNAIHAITQKGLDENLRSGLISKSAYDRASSMFRWYVPLRGFNQDTMEDMFKYDYSNKVEAGNVLKNAEGRLTLAWDPLSTATSMALNSISSAEKNLVKQAAYRLVNHWTKENPNEKPFAVVSDVWYRKNEKGEWEIVVPKFAENSSDKDITEQTNRWIEDMRTLEREGKAKRKVNKGDFIAPFSNKDNMRSNIVYLRINGQQKMIIFNGNPKVARILNAEMNPEIVPYWDELMRGMSALNTVFSITFTGTNFLRDTQFANNNIFNKENSIYHNEFTQNQAMLMGKVWGKSGYLRMYKAYKNGTLGNSKLEQYFREFMQHGGKTGISKYYTLEDAEKLIDYSFDKSRGMHYVKLPFNTAADFIEAVNERAENINRLAAYITSREMGRSVKRSISDAKEVTVNFNRKGASWKTAKYGNTKFEKAVGLMAWIYRHGYMFFNAGVQALYALGYNLKNNPVKTLTTVAAIPFLGGILMHVINELLIAASGGDDDDYANLSPWTRRNNLCIYLPTGTFLKIPLPIELRAFYGLADIAYSTFDNRYATGVNPWVEALSQISAVLPVDYTAAFSGNLTLYDVIAPDAFKPIIQAKENKDWTGAPLHKEPQFYNKYDANWTLAFDSENRIAVGLAKWANSIGNRDETNVSKGRFDFHPSTLSNIFEGYFGSAGKDFMRLFDIPSDPLNTYNWPFFRGFLQTPSDKNKYTRIKLKYNFYRDNAMEYKEMIDNYKKSENPDLVRKAYSEEFKNTLDYRMMQEVDKFIKKYEKPYNKEKKKEKYSEKEKKILDEAFMLEKKQLIETLEEMERTSDE